MIGRKFLILLTLAMASGGACGKNLWPYDGSFETGVEGFILPRDASTAYDGQYSLKMGSGIEYCGRKVFLLKKPNRRYSLVFYAKADRPITINAYTTDDWWGHNSGNTFRLSGTWQRCQLVLKPQKQVTSVELKLKKPTDATVWLDAVAFYEDRADEKYCPGKSYDVGCAPVGGVDRTIYIGEEPVKTTFAVRNNTTRAVRAKVSVQLENASSTAMKTLLQQEIELPAGTLEERPLIVLPHAARGYYVLRSRAEIDGQTFTQAQPVMVIDRPLPVGEDSMFGIHFSDGLFGRNLGASWSRTFEQWGWRQYKNGEYHLNSGPALFLTEKYGMFQDRCINLHDSPRELRDKGRFSPDEAVLKWARALLRSYRDKLNYLELENEPDLVFQNAPEHYTRLLNLLAPELRKIKPGIKLIGSNVSGVDFNANFVFTRKVLEQSGQQLDIISVHPYTMNHYIDTSRAEIGPENGNIFRKTLELKKLIRSFGGHQEIWFGEVGWALDVEEDYLSPAARRFAAYVPRLFVLGKAAGARKIMYFLIDDCLEKERYYYGIWRAGQPMGAAATYAATAQILEGAETLEVVANSDFHCIIFRHRDGRLFAAVWLSNDTRSHMKLDLPAASAEIRDMFNNPAPSTAGKMTNFEISGEMRYLFATGVDLKEFKRLLTEAQYELPPLKTAWEMVRPDTIRLYLSNIRTKPLQGTLRLIGGGLSGEAVSLALKPDESIKMVFRAPQNLTGKPLRLQAKTNLGEFQDSYRADLVLCPRLTPDLKMGSVLPGRGRLPVMDSRNYLLPNDPGNGWDGPANLSVESAVCYDQDNLYLLADVRDDIHFQKNPPGKLWAQDSIQLAIDSRGNAIPHANFDKDDYEFGFGLADGDARKELTYTYDTGRAGHILASVRCNIFRRGDRTCYRIAIPWRELKITPKKGTIFGFNFTVNDNDGVKLRYWMGLTPGIVDNKNPYAYKKFYLE